MPPREEIDELIARFLEGDATDQDVATLHSWLQEGIENRKYFDEVNLAFQASVTLNRINQQVIDKGWKGLQDKIGQHRLPARSATSLFGVGRGRYILKAASYTIALCALSYLIFATWTANSVEKHSMIISSSKGSNTHIVLPDSSDVWLNANSVLEYPGEFGKDSRVVILKGEAFFDIKKNQSKPFIVRTQDMNVTVKGTRFNVEAYENGDASRTTLEEGSVELYVPRDDRAYTMKPGDQITIDASNKTFHGKVDPSDYSAWKENELVFDNALLEDIIKKIENRYRVKFSVDKALAKREHFSITIEEETLDEVLALIQLSSQVKVRKEANQIFLFE